jgi:1-acyl-sn-glycerol-3-phosphate acyltransferase
LGAKLQDLSFLQRFLLRSFLFVFGGFIFAENKEILEKAEDPLIFALNHICSFEVLLVPAYLVYKRRGRKISFVIDWMYGVLPLIGLVFNQFDPIYVYNKRAKYRFMERFKRKVTRDFVYRICIEKLEQKRSIGLFPEGTRNKDPYQLKKGRKGLAYIALKANVPVLPVGIDLEHLKKQGRFVEVGGFMIIPEYRRKIMVVLRLMREAIDEVVRRL